MALAHAVSDQSHQRCIADSPVTDIVKIDVQASLGRREPGRRDQLVDQAFT
jgi:hypothetical protein